MEDHREEVTAAAHPVGLSRSLRDLGQVSSRGSWCVFGVPVSFDCQRMRNPAGGPAAVRGALPYFSARRDRQSAGKLWDWDGERMIDLRERMPFDIGDIRYDRSTDSRTSVVDRVRRCTEAVCSHGLRPMLIGGEHWVTQPVMEALGYFHDGITVIHFDAHTDYYEVEGKGASGLTNGNVMRQVLELPAVSQLIQLGIREFEWLHEGSGARVENSERRTIVSARKTRRTQPEDIFKLVRSDTPVYVSIDADILDPSCAPEVGWPVIGGLQYSELLDYVSYLSRSCRIIGADLVEVTSGHDRVNMAAMALAGCALEIIASAC